MNHGPKLKTRALFSPSIIHFCRMNWGGVGGVHERDDEPLEIGDQQRTGGGNSTEEV